MTNAQTEARAIGPERVSIKQTDGYEVNWYGVVTHEFDEDESTTHYVREDIHATALAAKDAELAVVKRQRLAEFKRAERAEAQLAEIDEHRRKIIAGNERLLNALIARDRQLAEANKALEPFAKEADQWEGYEDAEGLVEGWRNGPASSITVGHLRAARRAREAQGGENNG